MPASTDLPFGHNTLKIRALWIPDGAQVSMADITRALGLDPVLIPAVWVPEGGALPGYPYEHIGSAVFIPDEGDAFPRTSAGRRVAQLGGQMPRAAEPTFPSVPVGGHHGQRGVSTGTANGEVGEASPSDGFARSPVTGFAGEFDPSRPGAEQWLARYQRPNIDEAMRAWNALSDPRATLTALDAASVSNPVIASLAGNRTQTGSSPAGYPQLATANPPLRRDDTATGDVQPVSYFTSDINNSTARALLMSRIQLGTALHKLKDAFGLGGADDVQIHIPTGEVFFNGEGIGNLRDE